MAIELQAKPLTFPALAFSTALLESGQKGSLLTPLRRHGRSAWMWMHNAGDS
jgi:hypothetical protein